ncbi:hypothetical protein Ct9H90mP29_08910 [bacterium]|nr:MAG: hypothetical protein Ct9H90mP29_08910 [bacterium]
MDSLFFKEEHVMIRDMVRNFADDQIMPLARPLDEEEKFPLELVQEMGRLGLMGMMFPKNMVVRG